MSKKTTARKFSLVGCSCLICDASLTDATSVQIGIGPTCRKKVGLTARDKSAKRLKANDLCYEATVIRAKAEKANKPITKRSAKRIFAIADEVQGLGFDKLAERIRLRFIPIHLTEVTNADLFRWNRDTRSEEKTGTTGTILRVRTPFSRVFLGKLKGESLRYRRPVKNGRDFWWEVDRRDSRRVLNVLSQVWPGEAAYGSKGVFTIPTEAQFTKRYKK